MATIKKTMNTEQQINEYSERLKNAMAELNPKIEQLKEEAEKHSVLLSKEDSERSISLTKSGIIVIKFADVSKAEQFYNNL